jgi:hypothetical protein
VGEVPQGHRGGGLAAGESDDVGTLRPAALIALRLRQPRARAGCHVSNLCALRPGAPPPAAAPSPLGQAAWWWRAACLETTCPTASSPTSGGCEPAPRLRQGAPARAGEAGRGVAALVRARGLAGRRNASCRRRRRLADG